MAIHQVVLGIALFIALNETFGREIPNVGIVGGREAAPNSRPYMASLQSQGQHECGGVLVREDFVLTAAHCNRKYRVVLGVHDLSVEEKSKQVFDVDRSIPHPMYNKPNNDIMLLKLKKKATLTPAVQLIPLMNGPIANGIICSTAGWGDIDDNGTEINQLQEVNATIVPPEVCAQRLAPTKISSGMVCATGPSGFQGFCSGDSGGPLVCNGKLAGIVSFSKNPCASPFYADVYTRVPAYIKWIDGVLAENP
ncbi:mast cell protease 1A-like [Esox lucius]|uniref:Peptidase S1 domain-containing protein n=1 Tax=Esox lucius TaxID=8010 RepID=A0A3P8YTX7_ESOLU|nr:mast cell protease 1A-like [Esox lucius]